jgi:hypothetical protein
VTDEHLTDGWEPDLPVADTLLRRFLFNLAAFHEVPVAAAGGRVLRRDHLTAADLGRPAAMHNAATLLRPLPFDRASETLDEVEGFFDGHGSGEAYLWSAWPTPDLRPRGWVLEGHPPLLLRTPGAAPVPPVPPGLRVERVAAVDALRDWERVAVDGFPYRELQPYRPGTLLHERVLADGRLRLWVGYEDDRPVCVGSLFVAEGVATFSLGVTLAEARRRGYWAAMAAVRLVEEPGLPAVGVFSDMSRPSAEAIGFLPLTRFTLWHRPRPGPSTAAATPS